MRRYNLSPSLYEKLLNRGMYLICLRCRFPLRPKKDPIGRIVNVEVVSIRSLYRRWTCTVCGYKYGKKKPESITYCIICKNKGPSRTTFTGKRKIEPIIYDLGRKFYCGNCYNGTFHEIENGEENDEETVG